MQSSSPVAPLTLDSLSAINLSMGGQMFKEIALMGRNDVWHKVQIVRGGKYDKEVVLRAILAAVEPASLIPVRYEVSNDDAYFMARNCGAALKKLCRSSLIVPVPDGNPTVLVVTLAFASIHDVKINIQPILLAALKKRYNTEWMYLDLENFHMEANLAKTVYCPLSQTKTLAHTLMLAKTVLGPYKHLSLRHNELTSLAAMETSKLQSLKTLDVRHNKLLVMSTLEALKNLEIEELWLDGNPLCENYRNAQNYIESVKLYCPRLRKLDGIDLDTIDLLMYRDDYCTRSSISWRIVDQFLTHFFNIYDWKNRSLLNELYRKNSLYSMTLGILSNSQEKRNFGAFSSENRNLLLSSDMRKSRKLLYRGSEEIIAAFKRLPETMHDRKNFRYDIMWEIHGYIVVSVEGFFKVKSDTLPSNLYAFSRTFVLIGSDESEYNIVNDQCHVVVPHPLTALFHKIDDATPIEDDEFTDNLDTEFLTHARERMIHTLMNVTSMNAEWCHTFLNDANWNAEKALKAFMESYKLSKIPAEAFSK